MPTKGLTMKCLLFCFALILAASAVEAQISATAADNPTVPVVPRSSPSVPPERIAPSGGTTLSEQLSRGGGEVVPPKTNVDPGMTVNPPTESEGHMPIIPSPGSPDLVPK